jgi:hypothetical protein
MILIYVKKHKTYKISIISDDFNYPISIKIDTGSKHDVTILKEQLIEFSNSHPLLCNENNTIVADGYSFKKLCFFKTINILKKSKAFFKERCI